jgi:hypothetical protein
MKEIQGAASSAQAATTSFLPWDITIVALVNHTGSVSKSSSVSAGSYAESLRDYADPQ